MRKPRLRRHRAAVHPERAIDVLVPEVPAVKFNVACIRRGRTHCRRPSPFPVRDEAFAITRINDRVAIRTRLLPVRAAAWSGGLMQAAVYSTMTRGRSVV